MNHDPLCYRSHDKTLGGDPFCQCAAIMKAYQRGLNDALDQARNEAALAMCAIDTYLPPEEHNHVLAAINALKEKP